MMNLTWMPCVGRLLLLTQLTQLIAALTFDCRNGGGDRDVVFTFSFFIWHWFLFGSLWTRVEIKKSSHLFRSNHMSPSIRLFEMNTTIPFKKTNNPPDYWLVKGLFWAHVDLAWSNGMQVGFGFERDQSAHISQASVQIRSVIVWLGYDCGFTGIRCCCL